MLTQTLFDRPPLATQTETTHKPVRSPAPQPTTDTPPSVVASAPSYAADPGPVSDAPLLVDERKAAELLSVSPRTVWQLRKDGLLDCVRFGRAVRYDVAELRAFIFRSKSSST